MKFGFGAQAQADFAEDLANLVEYGADRALQEMARSYKGVSRDAALAIRASLANGRTIADGMRGWFDPVLSDAARAGEKSGQFAQAVRMGASILTQRSAAVRGVITSMVYPTVVLLAACGLIMLIALGILPDLANLVPPSRWTPMGRIVFEAGAFLAVYGVWLGFFAFGVVATVYWSLSEVTGDIRAVLDRFPPWSLYREFQAAVLMQNLALLLSTGVMLRDAIDLLSRQANPFLASHLALMRRKLARADTKSSVGALDTGLIGERQIRRLRLMEDAKTFETALEAMGARSGQDVVRIVAVAGKILTFVILLSAGGAIAVAATGLFQTLGQIG